MTKYKIFLSAVAGLILVSAVASAQTNTAAVQPAQHVEIEKSKQEMKDIRQTNLQNNQDVRKNALQDIQKIKQDTKGAVQQERQDAIQNIKNIRQGASTTPEANREAIKKVAEQVRQDLMRKGEAAKQAVANLRADFKQKIETNRTEAKKQIEAKQEELKQKLSVIKDERKKTTVENISTKFQDINAKSLENFSATLNRIEEIAQKIGTRADKAQAGGLDVSTVRSDIAAFQTALTAARSAIIEQTAKVYTINIVDEAALKANVDTVRQTLQADLKAVQDLVKAVRNATQIAANDLAKIPNINAFNNGTADISTSTPSSAN